MFTVPPPIGLGTWMLKGNECFKIVKEALGIGYRHIDTAHVYDNHKEIGKAIKGFPRAHLFLTSKLSPDQVDRKNIDQSVAKACDLALKELGTDFLDLYLIHWPHPSIPMDEIFSSMHKLIPTGKIRAVGVSNFTIHHLQDVLPTGLRISANQVEFHPHLYQQKLHEFCEEHRILLISYRPFGKGKLLQEEPLFQEIGAIYKKTGAQVILRWLIQKNIPTIPKASTKEHLIENIEIFDFSLSKSEMALIDSLHKEKRYCEGGWSNFNY